MRFIYRAGNEQSGVGILARFVLISLFFLNSFRWKVSVRQLSQTPGVRDSASSNYFFSLCISGRFNS